VQQFSCFVAMNTKYIPAELRQTLLPIHNPGFCIFRKKIFMAELKTKPNDAPVEKFLNGIKEKDKRDDCFVLLELIKKTTKQEPKMWGNSIVGFGTFHYKGASGREGDWFVTGFSPRKQNMTVYFCMGFRHLAPLMQDLGKYKTGMGCLYFKKLADINMNVLKEMLKANQKELDVINKQKKQAV